MKELQIRATTQEDIELIAELMKKYWGGEPLVSSTWTLYPSKLPGFLAFDGNEVVGFCFYEIRGHDLELIVIEALKKQVGLGTQLLNQVIKVAKEENCKRVFLVTHNDNLDALRFYQRRGFYIYAVHLNVMKEVRKKKPAIPLQGEYDIPLRDEIELEFLV